MEIKDIRKIAVIGAGVIGNSWTANFIWKGYPVNLSWVGNIAGTSAAFSATKTGNVVTLCFDGVSAADTGNAVLLTDNVLPLSFRPSQDIYSTIIVQENTTVFFVGRLTVLSTADLVQNLEISNVQGMGYGGAGGNNGFLKTCVTYLV